MPDISLEQWYAIAHTVIEAGIFFWALGKRADKALVNHLRSALKEDFLTRHEGKRIIQKLDTLLETHHGKRRTKDPA